jgi:hypothetical protein
MEWQRHSVRRFLASPPTAGFESRLQSLIQGGNMYHHRASSPQVERRIPRQPGSCSASPPNADSWGKCACNFARSKYILHGAERAFVKAYPTRSTSEQGQFGPSAWRGRPSLRTQRNRFGTEQIAHHSGAALCAHGARCARERRGCATRRGRGNGRTSSIEVQVGHSVVRGQT